MVFKSWRFFETKTVLPRKFELGLDTAFMKESRPVVMPGVDLRRAADPVVALPAEARPRRAMQLRQHLRQRCPVAITPDFILLEQLDLRLSRRRLLAESSS